MSTVLDESVEKAKAILTKTRDSMKKDNKERKKANILPLGLCQARNGLEKTKEQSKYKQYKVKKLRRQRLTGR